jgi:hypothetical protein
MISRALPPLGAIASDQVQSFFGSVVRRELLEKGIAIFLSLDRSASRREFSRGDFVRLVLDTPLCVLEIYLLPLHFFLINVLRPRTGRDEAKVNEFPIAGV